MSARSDAKSRGDKQYYTGVPCPKGHDGPRFVSSGGCVKCTVLRKAQIDRTTILDYARKSLAKNRDAVLARRRKKYAVDLDASRAKGREESAKYRATSKQQLKAAKRKHYLSRIDHISARNRKAYQANKEERRAAGKAWAKANPEKTSAASHAYRARKRNAPGRFTPADIDRISALQKGKCAYCRSDLKRSKRHIDHITALINGGSNKPSNIQLLCQSCNTSKQHRDPIYHARTLGMLL